MADLKKTIKLIMKYLTNKSESTDEVDLTKCYVLTIKKDLFFKNHIRNSLEKSYSNNKLNDLYTDYCKDNFAKNNIFVYK